MPGKMALMAAMPEAMLDKSIYQQTFRGTASWYTLAEHGLQTSSGEVYDLYRLTAAHASLPLGMYVRVKNRQHTVVVRINDRLPKANNHALKLSWEAAKQLKLKKNKTQVIFQVLQPRSMQQTAASIKIQANTQSTGTEKAGNALLKTSQKGLYLQLGAFSSYQNALQYQAQLLANLEQPVEVYAEQGLFRVQIGPIAETDVKTWQTYLRQHGVEKSILVSR
ncbi:septal ring lytic transglycosylase RlpA family protein [Candidatus Venteria ishoeyi]|nr:septal ring lytic transglycosylase RlpA family protein [Candidatus Venteria ishoeyi]MDM8545934.1 septal ring lytic transglycosylase RlpA family protein [Candidatus Venteria ishoeyi]